MDSKGHMDWSKLKTFDVVGTISNWWNKESAPTKSAFFTSLIVGFISHIFVYTGRYYGRDDMGTIYRTFPRIGVGRWFNSVMNILSYGYVMPLVYGIMTTFFLAVGASYICKLYNVQKKLSAVMIAGLVSTFPSIANTNLFPKDAPNYHFAVMLGIIAVYITFRYKFGCVVGRNHLVFALVDKIVDYVYRC